MESSGHYWMALAGHLRRPASRSPWSTRSPKYFAKSRLARTKSDPADARSLAQMAMRDTPLTRDPLAGVELRQAARFAMTLVTEQARVCQRLIRLVELGFPELGELFDDPACRTAREVLRVAPTAGPPPDASARARSPTPTPGPGIGAWGRRRPSGSRTPQRLEHRGLRARCRGRLRGGPAARPVRPARAPDQQRRHVASLLDGEMARRLQTIPGVGPSTCAALIAEIGDIDRFDDVDKLLDQYDLLERQISSAETHVASLLDGEMARRLQTIPGVGPSTCAAGLIAEIGDIDRFDDVDKLLAYAGVTPAERSSGRKGANPETSWHMSKAGNRAPPCGGLSHGRRGRPAQPGHRGPLRAQANRRQVEDERPGPLHEQGPQPRLGCLAQRPGLRPRLGGHALDKTLWDLTRKGRDRPFRVSLFDRVLGLPVLHGSRMRDSVLERDQGSFQNGQER